MDVVSEAAKFGPYAFMLLVIFVGLKYALDKLLPAWVDMNNRITQVVENNTEALTKLCDNTATTVAALEDHDTRAQRIETNVGQIARVVDRTEAKVDKLHEAIKGKP